MKIRKAVAVKMKSWNAPSLMMWGKDNVLYYAGYRQHIGEYNPDYIEITDDYGEIDFDDLGAVEALKVKHCRRYPPREGLEKVGWLLPSGRFFPCGEWEHDSTAYYVYRYVNGKNLESFEQVENHGWIRVYEDRIGIHDLFCPTQKQVDVLGELVMISDNERFKQIIRCVMQK